MARRLADERAVYAWEFERDFQNHVGRLERWVDLRPYEKYLVRLGELLGQLWSRTTVGDAVDDSQRFVRASVVRAPALLMLLLASAFTPLLQQYLPIVAVYWLTIATGGVLAFLGIAPKVVFHVQTLIDIVAVTVLVHLLGSITTVAVVFYPLMVVLITIAIGFMPGIFYAAAVTFSYTLLVVLEGVGVLPYSPLLGHEYPAFLVGGWPTYPIAVILSAHIITYGSALIAGALAYEIEVKRRQANEAVRSKSELLAICSHDLKNLLVTVTGYSELLLTNLRERPVSVSDLTLYAQHIHANGSRMLELIHNLLDSARLESRGIPLVKGSVELTRMVKEVAVLQQTNAAFKQAEVSYTVPETPVWIEADGSKLSQALTNLVQNAIIHVPDHRGRVTVDVSEPGGGRVRIAVRDNGPGIAADVMPILFDPTALAMRRKTARRRLGMSLSTGLGLSIVKRFVEMHGGQLAVECPPGCGTTFWIDLPWTERRRQEKAGCECSTARYAAATDGRLGEGGVPV